MRNLKPYQENSEGFYDKIIASKNISSKDPDYKIRLSANKKTISKQFEIYDDNFTKNKLEFLENHSFNDDESIDLIKLYSYRNKHIQKLKINVTTLQNNRIFNTCQNCTINEINTFDHFVNKSEFPEFSVHPKNLHPSCSVCNSYKGKNWREDSKILFLNLYLDNLPKEQYLFVDINIEDDVISPHFYINNSNKISADLFLKIYNHYEKLHLCKRFQDNSDTVITSLENTLKTYSNKLSLSDLTDLVIETSNRNIETYGSNYWKSILEIELIKNKEFLNLIFN